MTLPNKINEGCAPVKFFEQDYINLCFAIVGTSEINSQTVTCPLLVPQL